MPDLLRSTNAVARHLIDEVVQVDIRGYPDQCFKCGHHAVIPAVIHPTGLSGAFDVLDAAEGNLAAVVGDLLWRAGHPAASTIRVRRSRSTESDYISHGCGSCDVLFGAFRLHGQFTDLAVSDSFGALPLVQTAELTRLDWVLAEAVRASSDLG